MLRPSKEYCHFRIDKDAELLELKLTDAKINSFFYMPIHLITKAENFEITFKKFYGYSILL